MLEIQALCCFFEEVSKNSKEPIVFGTADVIGWLVRSVERLES
jgi:hypothetical protein